MKISSMSAAVAPKLLATADSSSHAAQLLKTLLRNIWAFHETEEGWDCAGLLTPYALWDFRDMKKVQAFPLTET